MPNENSNNLRDLIRKLAGTDETQSFLIPGEVIDVDKSENTCTVKPFDDDEPEYLDVLLQAASGRGMVLYPVVGSTVVLSLFDKDNASVAMFSEVETYALENSDDSLKEILMEIIDQILVSKYTTNTGATLKLINDPQFRVIKDRLDKFFER